MSNLFSINGFRDLLGLPFVIAGSLMIAFGQWVSAPSGKAAIKKAFEDTFWEHVK